MLGGELLLGQGLLTRRQSGLQAEKALRQLRAGVDSESETQRRTIGVLCSGHHSRALIGGGQQDIGARP